MLGVLHPLSRPSCEASLALGLGITVMIQANHRHPPVAPDASIDWLRVERVLIRNIEYVHG